MMTTKPVLNFLHRFDPLRPRLPLPEHRESLSTHAAMRLGTSIRKLAQNLHSLSPPATRPTPATKVNIVHAIECCPCPIPAITPVVRARLGCPLGGMAVPNPLHSPLSIYFAARLPAHCPSILFSVRRIFSLILRPHWIPKTP
jgi:hypothetical protein